MFESGGLTCSVYYVNGGAFLGRAQAWQLEALSPFPAAFFALGSAGDSSKRTRDDKPGCRWPSELGWCTNESSSELVRSWGVSPGRVRRDLETSSWRAEVESGEVDASSSGSRTTATRVVGIVRRVAVVEIWPLAPDDAMFILIASCDRVCICPSKLRIFTLKGGGFDYGTSHATGPSRGFVT